MALAIAPGVFLGIVFGALALWTSGAAAGNGATVGSEVHAVLQIHTKPNLANDSVLVDSSQLCSPAAA